MCWKILPVERHGRRMGWNGGRAGSLFHNLSEINFLQDAWLRRNMPIINMPALRDVLITICRSNHLLALHAPSLSVLTNYWSSYALYVKMNVVSTQVNERVMNFVKLDPSSTRRLQTNWPTYRCRSLVYQGQRSYKEFFSENQACSIVREQRITVSVTA